MMQTFTEQEVRTLEKQYHLLKNLRHFMAYAYVGTPVEAEVEQTLLKEIDRSLAATQEVLI